MMINLSHTKIFAELTEVMLVHDAMNAEGHLSHITLLVMVTCLRFEQFGLYTSSNMICSMNGSWQDCAQIFYEYILYVQSDNKLTALCRLQFGKNVDEWRNKFYWHKAYRMSGVHMLMV